MPHAVEHCSAYFCCNHIGSGVLLVAKALVMVWPPAIACLLQGWTAMHRAAAKGHVAVVETVLLSGADLEARDKRVSSSSLYKRFKFLHYIPIVPMYKCSVSAQGH